MTAFSEMFFDDEAAMAAAFATDAGKAAGGDAAAHCSNRFRMVSLRTRARSSCQSPLGGDAAAGAKSRSHSGRSCPPR